MKLPSSTPLMMKLSISAISSRSKKIASLIAVLSLCILLNFTYNIDTTKRQLLDGGEISKVMHSEEISGEEENSFLSRYLSINLGGGRCKWTPPEELNDNDNSKTTLLLAVLL